MLLLEVQVPEGLLGGDAVEFEHEGACMTVEVPAGLKAGDSFTVEVASAGAEGSRGEAGADDGGGHPTEAQLTVTVPEGVRAGDEICVESERGAMIVVVPEGLQAGMEFLVVLPRTECPQVDLTPPTGVALDDSPGPEDSRSAALMALYTADELRLPAPEPGYAFYVGQHVRMPRKKGGHSDGVVLEVVDGFETLCIPIRGSNPRPTDERSICYSHVRAP